MTNDESRVLEHTDRRIDEVLSILQELRGGQVQISARLDRTNQRIDETNERLVLAYQRIDEAADRISLAIRRVEETNERIDQTKPLSALTRPLSR